MAEIRTLLEAAKTAVVRAGVDVDYPALRAAQNNIPLIYVNAVLQEVGFGNALRTEAEIEVAFLDAPRATNYPEYVDKMQKVRDALREMTLPVGWYIDYNKAFHYHRTPHWLQRFDSGTEAEIIRQTYFFEER